MGINNLWPILEPFAQEYSLSELAIYEGYKTQRHKTGFIIMGVDASSWFDDFETTSDVRGQKSSQDSRNPELEFFFLRLAAYSRLPASLVFVFDGPLQPEEKHKQSTPDWLVQDFRDLIKAFGFHSYDAPGEAQAELAYLNTKNAIDFILTSNNNVFIFGATHVIRNPQNKNNTDMTEIYMTAEFARFQLSVSTPAGLFLFAVMNGGDYDTVGLPGCGPATARLLTSSNLGELLLRAARYFPDAELDLFLIKWRARLQHILSGLSGKSYQILATNIPDSFPNPLILRHYACPIVSKSVDGYNPKKASWTQPHHADIGRLVSLTNNFFGWGGDIFFKLRQHIWDGCCLRDMVWASLNNSLVYGLGPSSIRSISSVKIKLKSPTMFASYLVEVWLSAMIPDLALTLRSLDLPPTRGSIISSHLVWIPAPILERAVPELVSEYHASSKKPCVLPTGHYIPLLPPVFNHSENDLDLTEITPFP